MTNMMDFWDKDQRHLEWSLLYNVMHTKLLANAIPALLLIDLPLSYIASLDLIYKIAAASDYNDTRKALSVSYDLIQWSLRYSPSWGLTRDHNLVLGCGHLENIISISSKACMHNRSDG
jgi:hypothetical protein